VYSQGQDAGENLDLSATRGYYMWSSVSGFAISRGPTGVMLCERCLPTETEIAVSAANSFDVELSGDESCTRLMHVYSCILVYPFLSLFLFADLYG
jgi:hypothetical protein